MKENRRRAGRRIIRGLTEFLFQRLVKGSRSKPVPFLLQS